MTCPMDHTGKSVCAASNICGDGDWLDGTEGCDDGNLDNGDGCDSTCIEETGYTCTGANGTTQTCSTTCGDGVLVTATETCDDFNTADGDGCSADCSTEETGWTCT